MTRRISTTYPDSPGIPGSANVAYADGHVATYGFKANYNPNPLYDVQNRGFLNNDWRNGGASVDE